jgi:hypothetical protein
MSYLQYFHSLETYNYKIILPLNPETFSSCQLIKVDEIQGTSAFQNTTGLLMPDLLQYLGFDK